MIFIPPNPTEDALLDIPDVPSIIHPGAGVVVDMSDTDASS